MPLILADPDEPGGQTARQIVSLVDIFPTVLDFDGRGCAEPLELDGASLLPIVVNPNVAGTIPILAAAWP